MVVTRSVVSIVALALVVCAAGCSSLTEPNEITVTKEAEQAPVAQAPAAAKLAPQPGGQAAPQGAPQQGPGAAAPARPAPQPQPAPAKGGSCGE